MNNRGNAQARLAHTLQARMKALNGGPTDFDYGEITSSLSLKTNSFASAIPVEDYQICRSAGTLQSGDRVLMLWVGDDAIVIDVLVDATEAVSYG